MIENFIWSITKEEFALILLTNSDCSLTAQFYKNTLKNSFEIKPSPLIKSDTLVTGMVGGGASKDKLPPLSVQCKQCDYATSQASNLRKHVEIECWDMDNGHCTAVVECV